MTRRVGPSEQGELQGANGSVMGVATMIGPTLFAGDFAWSSATARAARARCSLPAGRVAARRSAALLAARVTRRSEHRDVRTLGVPEPLRAALADELEPLAAQAGAAADAGRMRAIARRACHYVWACSEFVADVLPARCGSARLARDRRAGCSKDATPSGSRADFADGTQLGTQPTMRFHGRAAALPPTPARAHRVARPRRASPTSTRSCASLSLARRRSASARPADHAARQLAARHGVPRGQDGSELPLLVLGMGKLGGGELNFSSDIDLVFLFPEHGETDGRAAARARGVFRARSASAWRSCSARPRPRASSTASTCGCGRSATPGRWP